MGSVLFRLLPSCSVLVVLCASPAAAQVDPSGTWHTWHTEHFRIHAHADLADLARHAAREAERAYGLLAGELEPPRGTIDLVVADNVDFANGFATWFPSNRLTVFVTPPAGTISLDEYDDWFRLVLTHELTHLFHLDRAGGVWRVLQGALGRAPVLFPNAYRPSWVKEGLATYYESRLSGAGRAHGRFHRQLLTAAALGGAWPGPGDISLATPRWPAGFAPYAWGAEFFALQATTHGDSVIPGFIERTSRRVWPLAVSGPLESAGGASLDDGWSRLRAAHDSGTVPERTILFRGLRAEPHPRVAPDGGRVAYLVSNGRSLEHIELRDVASDGLIATRTVQGAPQFAWIGDTLFVTQLEFTSPVTIRSDLYAWRPAGALDRLTRGARLDHPFAAPAGGTGAVDLAARGSRLVVLHGDSLGEMAAPPADVWSSVVASPDGRWLAGARHQAGRWDIVAWPPGRPDRALLVTDDAALDEDPVWDPDGESLLFVSDRSGLPQVYAAHVQDGTVRRLTDEPTGAREPAPVGNGELLYVTLLHDGFALVRAPVRPGRPLPASPEPPGPFEPAPPVAIRETGYQPWPALRPWYWLPLAHDEGATGLFLGAATSGSDAIGRTRYAVAATGSVSGPEFRPALFFRLAHSRWRRWSTDLGVTQSWDGIVGRLSDGRLVRLSERERLADVGVSYRWRRWRSSLTLRLAGELEETRFFNADTVPLTITSGPSTAGGAVAIRAAHLSQPALAVSPENGVAVSGAARRRWALDGSGTGFEGQGTLAGYLGLPLPGFAHWVLAGRIAGGASNGSAAGVLSIGGVSGDVFALVPGVAVGTGRRTFALRGYPRASGFTRVGVGVAELRIPLFLFSEGLWKLPVVVDRVSVTLFAEAGGAWTASSAADLTRFQDLGGELVFDLGVSYDVPLRMRLGGAVPLTSGLGAERGKPTFYVTFGPAF